MSLLMSRARARLAPGTVAVCDLLVCGVLFLVGLGVIGTAPTTGAEESAAWESAGWLYVGWLLGGLVLFAALWRVPGALAHVAAMLVSPCVVVFLPLGVSALLR
ncbi:hypothetical protein [Streptomyces xanthii]|nr:hypothetical protein [Streptomyces xanthii]